MIRKRLLLIFLIFSCFFVMVSSVSAADYYVNSGTSHKNIDDWMNNNAKNGDKLIFNTSSYDLTDTVYVKKSIIVGSYKKTKINFNKTATMFIINTSSKVVFNNLILNHEGKQRTIDPDFHNDEYGGISVILGTYSVYTNNKIYPSTIKCDVKNVVINSKEGAGIDLLRWTGHVSNSVFKTGAGSIYSDYWIGNIVNTNIQSTEDGITGNTFLDGEYFKWKGNIVNSNITTKNAPVNCDYWKGKISGSRIYSYGTKSNQGLILGYSQGTITKSIIRSNSGNAIHARNAVKITKNKIIATKGYAKVHRYLPDLEVYVYERKGSTYYFTIRNNGYENSKSSYLGIKYGKTIKKIYVKSINAKQTTTVKISIPSKPTTITSKIDYYNKIKEENKKNNIQKLLYFT